MTKMRPRILNNFFPIYASMVKSVEIISYNKFDCKSKIIGYLKYNASGKNFIKLDKNNPGNSAP